MTVLVCMDSLFLVAVESIVYILVHVSLRYSFTTDA